MPFSADALAAQQIQDRLKSLLQIIHEIEDKRHASEVVVSNLDKARKDERLHNSQKLKNLYKFAVTRTEEEEDAIRKALQKINEIRTIKNGRRLQLQAKVSANKGSVRKGIWVKMLSTSAQTLPLFVSRIGEKPPPLCGAIPADSNYVASVGDMVAALVKDSADGENWILAVVVSYNHTTRKYEVDDYLKENNQKGRHLLSRVRVMPLPLMRANPGTDPQALFPPGTLVMALFPQTTCFYKALVNKPPATHTDEYELLFEDRTYSEGYSPPNYVYQRYVIAFKQKNKQAI